MEEFFKTLNAFEETNPPVKQEEPDADGEERLPAAKPKSPSPSPPPSPSSEGTSSAATVSVSAVSAVSSPAQKAAGGTNKDVTEGTGLAEMGMEVERARLREADTAKRLAVFMRSGDGEKSEKKRRKKQRNVDSSADEEDEKKEDIKGPLTTFGHSSRPRRSVNYANIERGDEAQSQSLVKEFKTSKKRHKRTRDELDENYEESNRKKPPPKYKKWTNSLSTAVTSSPDLFDARRPDMEFAVCVPKVDDERPAAEFRNIGMTIDNHPAIKRSAGGFRKFIAWLSDSMILTMEKIVENRYILGTDAEDRKILKCIRHVYNLMPLSYRRDWEHAARMDVFESRKFVQGLCMPLSEIPVKSEAERHKPIGCESAVRVNCCSMEPLLSDMRQTAEHFLEHHDTVHFFGCDICNRLFTSRFELTKHECKEFCTYLLDLSVRGQTLELEAAYMFLCCAQCGIWLPVKTSAAGMRGWVYFATAMINHTCANLVPIVIYFRKILEDTKIGRMQLQILSSVDEGFPLDCKECETEPFETIAAAEEHFKTEHSVLFKCQKCPKEFGTSFMWRHHQQAHTSTSAQFAHYLMYSATFHPPPGSRRQPHVGFASEVPAYGGCTAAELEALEMSTKDEEFVEPYANVLRRKMLKWKPTPKDSRSSTESDSSYSARSSDKSSSDTEPEKEAVVSDASSSDDVTTSRKRKPKPPKTVEIGPPGDLGYDHIDRNALFKRTAEEQEAIERLEKLTNKHLFAIPDRLLEPEEVLKFLEENEGPSAREAALSNLGCALADEIAEATQRTVGLPITNCVDPLKDFLLVNKVYNYCPTCKLIFSTDVADHCSGTCQTPEESIMELSHAANGPHSGMKCIDPDCRLILCSVSSLRNHCILVHNRNVLLETVVPTLPDGSPDAFVANRYDRSVMTLVKHFNESRADDRSPMARLTDIDCFLPMCGQLERRMRTVGSMTMAQARMLQHQRKQLQDQIRPQPPPPPARAYCQQPYVQKNSMLVKPYRIPRTSRWYSCTWCDKEFETAEKFVDHLSKSHVFECASCGRAYANPNTKRTHVCTRLFADVRQRPGTIVTGECGVCNERLGIENVFHHTLTKHFPRVEYNQATGELLPAIIDPKVESSAAQQQRLIDGNKETDVRLAYRMKLIKMNMQPVQGVSLAQLCARTAPIESYPYTPPELRNVDPRLMCYLCEMTFDSSRELTEHLEEHPEQWARCPFCADPVSSHFDMQKHLMTKHVVRLQNRHACEFCHETLTRFPCSHFIYRCKRMPCCTICGTSHEPSNLEHLQRTHKLILKRFQCGFCPSYFISMSEYYEHACSGVLDRVYACGCAPHKYFSSISGFCDHFDSMHVGHNQCLVCGLRAQSQEVIAKHRTSHLRTEQVRVPPRKIYIIVQWLYPKKDSGYSRMIDGGLPPPAYTDIDRSHHFGTLMAMTTPSSRDSPVSTSARTLTLFDVLEGGHQAPKGPILPHRRVAAVPTPAVANDEVIMLSDDDDDIVFEGAVVNGVAKKVENNNTPPEMADGTGQFTSQVRVEQSGDGYGGAQQPGYVDEDVEMSTDVRQSPPNEPIVKEVVDEHGDDELAVVAEVEHATGVLPSNVSAGRSKNFKCPQCSLAFYTNHSLNAHIAGHRQDAGRVSSKETYGMPLTGKAWICRNCCIAFECQKRFTEHMSIHGDTVHTCPHCSGISFNQSTMHNHAKAHDANSVMYACGTCMIKFSQDLALMDHLYAVHSMALFFFCKVCGLGSTEINYVFQHAAGHTNSKYTISQRIGACPATLLNYEPADEEDLRMKILTKEILVHKPSDCSHRTLLLSNETVVACKECFCTQAWFNYLAHNNYLEEKTPVPQFRLIESPPGNRFAFPLVRHLNDMNQQNMMRFAKVVNVSQRANGRFQHQTTPSNPANILPRRVVQAPRISAPLVSVTSNGARVIRPAQGAPVVRVNPIGGVVTNRNSMPGPPRRLVVARPPNVPIAARPVVGDLPKCEDCKSAIKTDYDNCMHSMHNSPDSWFCRQCGISRKSEIELFLHYMRDHLTPAYEKFSDDGTFKPSVFKLCCPFNVCNEKEFSSTKIFERHIRNAHSNVLPFQSSSCDAQFATQELCDKHDQEHNAYLETNGTDSSCCPLCGTLEMWSLPKDPNTDCLQSHIIRHGLAYRSACRCCLAQFPADTPMTQVFEHIRKEHSLWGQGEFTCRVCGRAGLAEAEFFEHCRNEHVFHILVKSSDSTRGELVVTAGQEYTNYVGIKSQHVRPPVLARSLQQQRQQSQMSKRIIAIPPASSSSASSSAAMPFNVTMENGGNAALQSIADALSGIGDESEGTTVPYDGPTTSSMAEMETIE